MFWFVAPSTLPRFAAACRAREEVRRKGFVPSLRYLPLPRPAARLADEFKRDYAGKETTLNLGDVIMAAVAIHDELTLLTDNTRDFPMADLSLYPLPKV